MIECISRYNSRVAIQNLSAFFTNIVVLTAKKYSLDGKLAVA